ncbi:hypothetical protein AB0D59_40190 [Streptomyces sp. NPDC048417]|uniref:hypothetical protein n=1 Tax=Streptomyces sp. NPDC048417 TaxID=3155387 RepID=UPI00341D9745
MAPTPTHRRGLAPSFSNAGPLAGTAPTVGVLGLFSLLPEEQVAVVDGGGTVT